MTALTACAIVLLALLASAIRWVPAGHVHSLYRRGRPIRWLQPGLHLVLPGLERIGHRIDLAGRVLQFQESLVGAHDVHGTVYWQVLEPERVDAVIDEVDHLIKRSTLEALRDEAEPTRIDRRALGSRLKRVLNGALRERGMMITRVELDFA